MTVSNAQSACLADSSTGFVRFGRSSHVGRASLADDAPNAKLKPNIALIARALLWIRLQSQRLMDEQRITRRHAASLNAFDICLLFGVSLDARAAVLFIIDTRFAGLSYGMLLLSNGPYRALKSAIVLVAAVCWNVDFFPIGEAPPADSSYHRIRAFHDSSAEWRDNLAMASFIGGLRGEAGTFGAPE